MARNAFFRLFFPVSGIVLFATAMAKFVSASGESGILIQPDPLFSIPYRWEFIVVGTIEVIVAVFCFSRCRVLIKAMAVSWLATGFAIYRMGLAWIGGAKACSCLGSLTDALKIDPGLADAVMLGVMFFLLLGGYATLFMCISPRRTFLPPERPSSGSGSDNDGGVGLAGGHSTSDK